MRISRSSEAQQTNTGIEQTLMTNHFAESLLAGTVSVASHMSRRQWLAVATVAALVVPGVGTALGEGPGLIVTKSRAGEARFAPSSKSIAKALREERIGGSPEALTLLATSVQPVVKEPVSYMQFMTRESSVDLKSEPGSDPNCRIAHGRAPTRISVDDSAVGRGLHKGNTVKDLHAVRNLEVKSNRPVELKFFWSIPGWQVRQTERRTIVPCAGFQGYSYEYNIERPAGNTQMARQVLRTEFVRIAMHNKEGGWRTVYYGKHAAGVIPGAAVNAQ